jgi:hypothetical protein
MILFLDFDGVLHPGEVFRTSKGPQLRSAGELFMWASILEAELEYYPTVRIVLSTSWVRELGFSRAKTRLPAGLRARVVGSTWHSSMAEVWADQVWWDQASRYAQILRYVARAKVPRWVAIDDDADGWATDNLDRLLLSDQRLGLTTPGIMETLRDKLTQTT